MLFKSSFSGISNTIGRVFVGFVSDYQWVNCLIVTNLSLLFCGISVIILPECRTYEAFMGLAITFGFSVSAYSSLQSVVVVHLFGLENLTYALGFLKFFIGIASIVGPPFAGFLYDQTESYHIPFYVAGVVLVFSTIFSCLALYQQKKKRKEELLQLVGFTNAAMSEVVLQKSK